MRLALLLTILTLPFSCDTSGQGASDTGSAVARGGVADQGGASADSAQSAEEIIRLEREWAAAIQRKDTAATNRLKAADFVYVGPDGKIYDRAASQTDVMHDKSTYTEMGIENPRVRVYGNTAVIIANSTDRGTGPNGAFANRYTFTDVWVRQGGTWKVVSDHVSRIPEQ